MIDIELDEAALVEGLSETFGEQIAAWRQAGHFGVPVLALGDTIAVRHGRCLSCGIPAEGWRCDECLKAVELALELADVEGVSFTPPPASSAPFLAEVEENLRDRHEPWEDKA